MAASSVQDGLEPLAADRLVLDLLERADSAQGLVLVDTVDGRADGAGDGRGIDVRAGTRPTS